MDKAAIDTLLDQLFALAEAKVKNPMAKLALATGEALLKGVVEQYLANPAKPGK